jgi:hypothetical protein
MKHFSVPLERCRYGRPTEGKHVGATYGTLKRPVLKHASQVGTALRGLWQNGHPSIAAILVATLVALATMLEARSLFSDHLRRARPT